MKYWTKSWNVIYGCSKCRAGCTNCWAEQMARRMKFGDVSVTDSAGNWTGIIAYKPERLNLPLSWKMSQIVAVNWMSDTFHPQVPPHVWPAMLAVMGRAQQHKYLVLTKRYKAAVDQLTHHDAGGHIYIGTTISNQADADEARDYLVAAYKMGYKTWVSFEPALEVVDWSGYNFLDGMVCGPETGRKARPMPIQAAIEARDFCVSVGIPFTFKTGQLGQREWFEFPGREAAG